MRRRRGWVVGAALCILLAGAIALWTLRRSLATALIDRKLAEAHVRARYRIADLGFGRQRLVDVVIGDPSHPDLVAKWIELATRVGVDGARITGLRADGLRVRGRVVDGQMSLGAIDRLLPSSPGGSPIQLPSIDVRLNDSRLELATPYGNINARLDGGGRLDDGFDGVVTASANRLMAGGCTLDRIAAKTRVSIRAGEPSVAGPLTIALVDCGTAKATDVDAKVSGTLGRKLATWRGAVQMRADRVAAPQLSLGGLNGSLTFAGAAAATSGTVILASGPAHGLRGVTARELRVKGRYRIGADTRFAGKVAASGASLPATMFAGVRRQAASVAGTPAGPLAAQAATAITLATRDLDVSSDMMIDRQRITISEVTATAASGATASLSSGTGQALGLVGGMLVGGGSARLSGGGLPTITLAFDTHGASGPFTGMASLAPYVAGAARLAMSPVRFSIGRDGGGRVDTDVTLSGPLTGGRVDGLIIPAVVAWDRAGVLTIGPRCTRVGFDRLTVPTLKLRDASFQLCPAGATLLRIAGPTIRAEARIAPFRLAGSLGASPLTVQTGGMSVSSGRRGFAAKDVAVRLGVADAMTRVSIGRLDAAVAAGIVQGGYSGAEGRIGTVPLALTGATGRWRIGSGAVALDGEATVADVTTAPRFKPLLAKQLRVRLAQGVVTATASLVSTARAVAVADVAITHDLGRGSGHADMTVPELSFDGGFQPDALTPLTFGVIADVRGAVSGDARLAWDARGITSTGVFRTDGIDLAAAFGPVTGLAGTIRFTDLLALESAPGQVATIATINPGVVVTNGRLVYQTLPDARVRVLSGHWPFAGGSLDLQPTLLDLAATTDRHLTFTLAGVDAGRFLQQFDFRNISATGAFDGSLPMVFDAQGGRIEGGQLGVRRGGGNIAYVGDLTQHDLGFWGNLAFGALRSINYRDLEVAMNGPLAGEMITEVRFAGISQGKGAKSNFLVRQLQKLPFVFNIRIRAPFRGLIDSAQSFYDPSSLIERNLPALIKQQNDAVRAAESVQPRASDGVPTSDH